jgi:hypothetical protein
MFRVSDGKVFFGSDGKVFFGNVQSAEIEDRALCATLGGRIPLAGRGASLGRGLHVKSGDAAGANMPRNSRFRILPLALRGSGS